MFLGLSVGNLKSPKTYQHKASYITGRVVFMTNQDAFNPFNGTRACAKLAHLAPTVELRKGVGGGGKKNLEK